jgi:hypothetical protein
MNKVQAFFCFTVFLWGCDVSPLLSHDNAIDNLDQPSDLQVEALSACPLDFPGQDLCASLAWLQKPLDDEKGELLLRFWKKSTPPLSDTGPFIDPPFSVTAKLWMPDMGHGSSPTRVVPEKSINGDVLPGEYRVQEVYFVMPGKWEIWVELKQDRTVMTRAKIDFNY